MNLYRLKRRVEGTDSWTLVTKRNSRSARIYQTLGDAKRALAQMAGARNTGVRWGYRIEATPIQGWEVVDG